MTRIHFFPERLRGNGPTISMAIRLNGSSMMGSGMRGAGGVRLEEVSWHSGHDLQ